MGGEQCLGESQSQQYHLRGCAEQLLTLSHADLGVYEKKGQFGGSSFVVAESFRRLTIIADGYLRVGVVFEFLRG